MASLTVTIPDDKVDLVVAALRVHYPDIDPTQTMNNGQLGKAAIIRWLKEVVKAHRVSSDLQALSVSQGQAMADAKISAEQAADQDTSGIS